MIKWYYIIENNMYVGCYRYIYFALNNKKVKSSIHLRNYNMYTFNFIKLYLEEYQ